MIEEDEMCAKSDMTHVDYRRSRPATGCLTPGATQEILLLHCDRSTATLAKMFKVSSRHIQDVRYKGKLHTMPPTDDEVTKAFNTYPLGELRRVLGLTSADLTERLAKLGLDRSQSVVQPKMTETELAIVGAIGLNITHADIAKQHNMTRENVTRIAAKYGLQTREVSVNLGLSSEEWAKIDAALDTDTFSISELARAYNVSRTAIYNHRKRRAPNTTE